MDIQRIVRYFLFLCFINTVICIPNFCLSNTAYRINVSSEFIELLSQKCIAISQNFERKKLICEIFSFYGKVYGKYIFNKYAYLIGDSCNNYEIQPKYDNLKYDKDRMYREIIETIVRYDESFVCSKVFRTREEEIIIDAEFAYFFIIAKNECISFTEFDACCILSALECFVDRCVDKNNKLLKPAKSVKESIVKHEPLSTKLLIKVVE